MVQYWFQAENRLTTAMEKRRLLRKIDLLSKQHCTYINCTTKVVLQKRDKFAEKYSFFVGKMFLPLSNEVEHFKIETNQNK